jgi:hypothetical protein
VEVPTVTVARAHPGYLTVGVIEDHVLTHAVPGRDLALPPAEHGLTLIVLHFEVPRGPILAKPHELPSVVDYHRAVLPSTLFESDEDVPCGSIFARLRSTHLDGGRAKVRARAERPHALRRVG